VQLKTIKAFRLDARCVCCGRRSRGDTERAMWAQVMNHQLETMFEMCEACSMQFARQYLAVWNVERTALGKLQEKRKP